MWNVQCILAAHASLRLACLLLLFIRFFRRQWVFLLRFRVLHFRLIELLNLSHIGLVRHCCRGHGASCEQAKSGLCCGRRRVPSLLFLVSALQRCLLLVKGLKGPNSHDFTDLIHHPLLADCRFSREGIWLNFEFDMMVDIRPSVHPWSTALRGWGHTL